MILNISFTSTNRDINTSSGDGHGAADDPEHIIHINRDISTPHHHAMGTEKEGTHCW
jgi:hypothetical protein